MLALFNLRKIDFYFHSFSLTETTENIYGLTHLTQKMSVHGYETNFYNHTAILLFKKCLSSDHCGYHAFLNRKKNDWSVLSDSWFFCIIILLRNLEIKYWNISKLNCIFKIKERIGKWDLFLRARWRRSVRLTLPGSEIGI